MIELWKIHKVEKCVMTFDCGGDSMGNTEFVLYDKNDNTVECPALIAYFEDEVYRNVEFYEASDGHYQGEFGTVTISLEGEDEEDYEFYYDKSSQSEWSETETDKFKVKLSDEQYKFVSEKVLNINGGDGSHTINYKIDCILTDEEEKLGEELSGLLSQNAESFNWGDDKGEYDGWFSFTTDIDGDNTLTWEDDNTLVVSVSASFRVYKEEEN